VTHDAYTMLRPLVMDFRSDLRAREIGDQYMFGPAFLVSPGHTYRARSRTLYLPQNTTWYDLWTGSPCTAASQSARPAPYDTIPCTFAQARSCLSVPSWNTPMRSRPIL
jgi:alpha-D-xyloside xylohydrolase